MKLNRDQIAGFLLCILAPLLVWGIHLSISYGFQASACAHGAPERPIVWILGATAILGAFLLGLVVRPALAVRASGGACWPEDTQRFARRATRYMAILSLIGAVWVGGASLYLSPCLSMR